MLHQMLIGSVIVLLTAVFHVSALVVIAARVRFRLLGQKRTGLIQRIAALAFLVLAVVAIHSAEVWMWAFFYLAAGEFTELGRALYFSATTLTTLGYGDITLSERWQLLGTFEALSGLILIGVSTAFMFEMMRRLLDDLG